MLLHDVPTENLSNRLAVLAAEIRTAHQDICQAHQDAAQRTVDAGRTIVDPFCGTAMWGEIAASMGRRWIGADIAAGGTETVAA
jgi:hypothetical protein